ncbi:aspartate aminotransferase family protein [Parvibaculum sp.]|uniref:aspartate aminotransferase family protein n=1 Tax=Parvibaculum sp. TaxID=2024848 RepID=UPI000C5AA4AB|nr:aspartate aminotransferase family protein [Parvibaculum sp.]MAM95088.1 aspartate aminotransferase family protein [Parvibaculum sp.]
MSADAMPNDLESFWLPFTPNRQFKREPRIVSRAKDMYYYKPDGTAVLDATAGLWCSNAGHCREPIVRAIQEQAGELDFAPSFQFGHPKVFELASRIAELTPDDLDHVFFCNSGSEAADSALKMAIAYHRANGEGTRTRLIGRERGYHGVGFGGISVGGMVANRKFYGPLLSGTDHLPHTYNRAEQAFTVGEPEWGAHLADELQRMVDLHDASTIAAVIVEPMAGSTGVLPPPKGYLKRLRELCDKHGILLIFDEVITGFGRLGHATAAERFGVTPDIMTFAKGVTSGTVPMGGCVVRKHIYEAYQTGPDHMIDLFHGYTYSGHPLAAAAGLATLDLYRDEGLFERSKKMEPVIAQAAMGLKDHALVQDIRTIGLVAAFDLAGVEGLPGKRGFDAMRVAFHEENMMVRVSGDTIAFSPPLIVEEKHIEEAFDKFRRTLDKVS